MISLYEYESRFQKQFSPCDAIDFECPAFLMRNEIIRLLQDKGIFYSDTLEDLHKWLTPEQKKYDGDYGINGISSLFYETDEQFAESYLFFIESIRNHFDTPFYFQKTPTIRIHCPDSKGAGFYPCYHNDSMFGHPVEEINLWIPLTQPFREQAHGFRLLDVHDSGKALEAFNYDAHKMRAYYSEHALRDKDCYPGQIVTTPFGKLTAFDSRCIHTAEPMLHHTRVSMDIRILPVPDFNPARPMQGTGRRKVLYAPGNAYHAQHSHELG